MTLMMAQRGDVELVRNICEWLVTQYRKDLEAGARQRGASINQARTMAQNGTAALMSSAEGINDQNVSGTAAGVIDACFQRHYNAGKPQYDKAMAWFADQLRVRVKDDATDLVRG